MKYESLTKGQAVFARKDDVLILKYHDKKVLHLLSTKCVAGYDEHCKKYYGGKIAFKNKPSIVTQYNQLMGSVDKADQLLEPYSYEKKSLAWYKKLGLHFMHRALLNSHLIYKKQQGPEYKKDFLDFTTKVAEQLISRHSDGAKNILQTAQGEVGRRRRRKEPRIEPLGHGRIPLPTKENSNIRMRKRCKVCYAEIKYRGLSAKKCRKDTTYHCPECDSKPGLCSNECFTKWHDKKWHRKYKE